MAALGGGPQNGNDEMSNQIAVVGAANVDITASPLGHYRPCESNPSRVSIGFGGVGRNIAHNLRLLGDEVRFVSVFGSDAIARTLLTDCRRLGLLVEPVITASDARSNYFVCINNEHGEMQAGAADMELMSALTPERLEPAIGQLDQCQAVVADCNVGADVLQLLARRCRRPLYVDATSVAKSKRVEAVFECGASVPVTLKVNRSEAQALAGIDGPVEAMAEALLARGAARVYITLGAEGIYCRDAHSHHRLAAQAVPVVNATGAGDAFMAAMVHGESSGMTMAEAAALGLRAAALALQSATAVSKRIRSLCAR